MKKSITFALISIFILSSCGPRRYKCGPYRKCEVKPETKNANLEMIKSYEVNS